MTFRDGHIKGSWFIGLNGQFAPWAGALIEDLHQAIVIIADEGKEGEAFMRLARVGYDNVVGYLDGGMDMGKLREIGVAQYLTMSFAKMGVGSARSWMCESRQSLEKDIWWSR